MRKEQTRTHKAFPENQGPAAMNEDGSPNPKKVLLGVLIMDCLFWASLVGFIATRLLH